MSSLSSAMPHCSREAELHRQLAFGEELQSAAGLKGCTVEEVWYSHRGPFNGGSHVYAQGV